MSLASEALHYRKGGVTYDVPLFTTEAEAGDPKLAVRVGGNTRYAPIASVGDSRATYIRVQSNGVIRAVKRGTMYWGEWELIGVSQNVYGIDHPPNVGYFWLGYPNISLAYDDLYSEALPYNLRFVWTDDPYAGYGDLATRTAFSSDYPDVALPIGQTMYARWGTKSHYMELATAHQYVSSATTGYRAGMITAYRVVPR